MDYNELKQFTFELINRLDTSTVGSVNIEFEQTKISISKSGGVAVSPCSTTAQADDTATYTNEKTVFSPMVGTFYNAPTPDSKPFIEVGDKICSGETICIIEAMKLMNEIVSDQSGVVKKILIQNGDVVEYNQPLIIVE